MSVLAPTDFSKRLVPRPAKASQAPKGAGAEAHDASAAFAHYTEEFRVGARETTAPASTPTPSPAGAVVLSTASRFILRLIAAHDGCGEHQVLARLIAAEGHAIGLPALLAANEKDVVARIVAAEGERIGLSPLLAKASADLGDDLTDLPDFARRAQNRFRADEAHGHERGPVLRSAEREGG